MNANMIKEFFKSGDVVILFVLVVVVVVLVAAYGVVEYTPVIEVPEVQPVANLVKSFIIL